MSVSNVFVLFRYLLWKAKNRVSLKSRLKTIRRLNPLVIFPVKVRNSFQKQKV